MHTSKRKKRPHQTLQRSSRNYHYQLAHPYYKVGSPLNDAFTKETVHTQHHSDHQIMGFHPEESLNKL
jgi:hypothetical protein